MAIVLVSGEVDDQQALRLLARHSHEQDLVLIHPLTFVHYCR